MTRLVTLLFSCSALQGGVLPVDSTPDNSVVLYMVSRHANINEKDNYGCTPLHFAAMRGNELVTYELLQCPGVDIGVRAVSKRTTHHIYCVIVKRLTILLPDS